LDEIDKQSKNKNEKDSLIDEVQIALFKEVGVFNRRETLIAIFRVCFYLCFRITKSTTLFIRDRKNRKRFVPT